MAAEWFGLCVAVAKKRNTTGKFFVTSSEGNLK
jgi:hypothetical protein